MGKRKKSYYVKKRPKAKNNEYHDVLLERDISPKKGKIICENARPVKDILPRGANINENKNPDRFPLKEINNCQKNTDDPDTPDCDVYQNIPILECEYAIEEEQISKTDVTVNGYRIIDFGYLYEQLQEISHHNSPLGCNFNNLKLSAEYRCGFHSKFIFVCTMCNIKLSLKNCRKPTSKAELTLNENVVSSFMSIGTGFAGLQQVAASLEIPSMSQPAYAKSHAKVCELWELAKEKSMEEVAKDEYELAIRNGEVNAEGVPMIKVVVDGCWSKRSYRKNYSALSGAAVIIGYRTKKVLYMAVKNKYCMVCARAENHNIEIPKEHLYFKNYKGSSSGMESAALVEGFKSSLSTYGLIYSKVIADGDSSTYKNILEANPYGNIIVEKIECTNHLLRNFCTKLDDLTKNTRFELRSRKILGKNILRLRRSVKGAAQHINSQVEKSFEERVKELKEDLLNAPNHVFGDHSCCKPYFCKNMNNEKKEENFVPEMKSNSIFATILQIMCRLVNNAKSLIHNVNSNIAEVFNSVIAKYVGGKRINFSLKQSYKGRCAGAVVSFNSKKTQSYICKKVLLKSPNPLIKRLEMQRNMQRLVSVKRRLTKSYSLTKKTNSEDKDYGDMCQKPDLSEADFDFAKNIHMANIQLSDEARQSLERRTRLQADSIEWHQERKLRLTASDFGKVCKRGLIKCAPLVKTMTNPTDLSHVKAIQHGKDHEPLVIKILEEILRAEDNSDNHIEECGLFVDPKFSFIAVSPDGLYKNDAIIEVKCPYSASGMSVEKGIELKHITFWKIDKDGNITLNKNHNWYYQAQGQLHVTGRNVCIFAVWTDINIRIEKIKRDDEFWKKNMEKKLNMFYFDCLLPEIIDSRLARKMEIREPDYILRALEKREVARAKKRKTTNNLNNKKLVKRKKNN